VLPQDFEDTVHARQLKALCRRVGRRMSRQGPGRSPSMGLTHLNAARPREKSSGVPHCGSSKILSDLVSHRRATRPTWLMHGSRPQAAWPCACTRSPTLRSHRTCDSTPLLHPLFRSRIPELSFGRPRVAIHEDLDAVHSGYPMFAAGASDQPPNSCQDGPGRASMGRDRRHSIVANPTFSLTVCASWRKTLVVCEGPASRLAF